MSVYSFFERQRLPLRANMKMPVLKHVKKVLPFIFLLGSCLISSFSFASGSTGEEGSYDPKEFAMHHVMDSHEWHIVKGVVIHLPCIVYHDGFHFFNSARLPEYQPGIIDSTIIDSVGLAHSPAVQGIETYKGFYLNESGKIVHEDGKFVLDLSITKNVATLLIVAILLILTFTSVAKSYKRREGMAPKGLQSLMEPLILFIRDDVVKSNLGKKTDKYFPFIMTVFFFILFGNLLGLIPLIGSPNLTGNITITMALALMTFIITNLHANKYYWQHIIWPPGVPPLVNVILVPIEIMGIFIKPFALMVRLFANITAGHIVIVSLIGLIFIFSHAGANLGGGLGAAAVAVPFSIFMSFLELLVAFLQAYIFAMLSALFIALAQEEHHGEDHQEFI